MATAYTKEQLTFLRGKRVMVATPCYGGNTTAPYTMSIVSLFHKAYAYGVDFTLSTIANESLVTRARNDLVNIFMNHEDERGRFDLILFIDADIQFDPDSVYRMIVHNKDIVAASYPLKSINFKALEKTKSLSVAEMATVVSDYSINIKFASEEKAKKLEVDIVGGLLEVHDAGTGFMMIKRNVFEKFIEAYPNIKYKRDMVSVIADGSIEKTKIEQYAYFDTSIDEDKRYLSEDYTFCRRWQKLGGKIWVDPEIVLNHSGTYLYKGRKIIDFNGPMPNAKKNDKK